VHHHVGVLVYERFEVLTRLESRGICTWIVVAIVHPRLIDEGGAPEEASLAFDQDDTLESEAFEL
jgi:hypothetical protein